MLLEDGALGSGTRYFLSFITQAMFIEMCLDVLCRLRVAAA